MSLKRLLTVGVVLLLMVLAGFASPSFAQLTGPAIVAGPCPCEQYGDSRLQCVNGECVIPIRDFQTSAIDPTIKKVKEAQFTKEISSETYYGGVVSDEGGYEGGSVKQILAVLSEELGGDEETGHAGALGSATKLIAGMFSSPPANTYAYVSDLAKGMNIATPAYAQGIGFSSLEPILEAWKITRNVAYLFFVLIFLGIGFMIMFRRKVGQTAVTAQQAIPNIVVSLIMVTFSYAIAGLLIDLMYLVMFLMNGLFNKTSVELIGLNSFSLAWHFITHGSYEGAVAIGTAIEQAIGIDIIGDIAGVISGLTALVIILVVIVFNIFKLFFALLKVYVRLILNIAFAPLILMMGAVPGQKVFMPWVRSLIGNLAVFPAILMVILIFQMLIDVGNSGNTGFSPPYMLSGLASSLPVIAGLALVMALPNVVDEVQKKLGGDKQGMFGGLIEGGLKDMWDRRRTGIKGATAPVTLGTGALLGSHAGGKFADRTGLAGWKKTATRAVGAGAGMTVGYNFPKIAMGLTRGGLAQNRDAIIKMQSDRIQANVEEAFAKKETAETAHIVEGQKGTQKEGSPEKNTQAPSGSRMDRFRGTT